MDETPEEKAPKAKARRAKGAAHKGAADVPAAKPRKVPVQRKASGEVEKAAKPAAARKTKSTGAVPESETKPVAKKPRAPARQKRPRQTVAVLAEPATAAAISAPAELPLAGSQADGSVADVAIHPVEPHLPSDHPHDDGLEFGLSPVDLAPDALVREEAGLGWFVRILAFSSVMLVLLNSFAIDKWAREQPVTRLNSEVLIAAHQLHAEMKSVHLDAPLEGLRSVWHGIRDARWPGSTGNRPAK